MSFPLTPRSMTLDDPELLLGQILFEFRDYFSCFGGNNSYMNEDRPRYCQQRNCSPLNVLFTDI